MPSSSAWNDAPVVVAGGNAPLRLSAGGAWLVETGQVEVFADLTGPEAARRHIATVPAGGLILGAGEARGLSLLAIGGRDTRLRDLGEGRWERAAADPRAAAELAPLLDGWIASLLSSVRGSAPKAFKEIRPGEDLALAGPGVAARPGEGVVWIRPAEGACRFLGEEDLTVAAGELLPVPEVGWVVATGECRLAAASTPDLLRGGIDGSIDGSIDGRWR